MTCVKNRSLQIVGQTLTNADMQRITVRIPREWHQKLAAIAAAENLKVSDILRRAVAQMLAGRKRAA